MKYQLSAILGLLTITLGAVTTVRGKEISAAQARDTEKICRVMMLNDRDPSKAQNRMLWLYFELKDQGFHIEWRGTYLGKKKDPGSTYKIIKVLVDHNINGLCTITATTALKIGGQYRVFTKIEPGSDLDTETDALSPGDTVLLKGTLKTYDHQLMSLEKPGYVFISIKSIAKPLTPEEVKRILDEYDRKHR